MKLPAKLSLVLLFASALPARAQPPPLHLADAVAWARTHHPSLAAAAARVKAAEQGPVMARNLAPPMLEAQIWQWPVTSINPADVNMYMFMAQQDLPGRGKRPLRTLAAERQVDVVAADAAVRDREVVTGVLEAYAALRATERGDRCHARVPARYPGSRAGHRGRLRCRTRHAGGRGPRDAGRHGIDRATGGARRRGCAEPGRTQRGDGT